jgi:transcriptional regulator with XRE-family HTH domain
MEIFAENLRKRINDLGLTQAEAARRCDLENRRFHHYIVGDREPDLRTLLRIATVLNTTPDELLGAKPAAVTSTDEVSRLRAKLIAMTGTMDPQALRLLSVLADGVVAFMREGGSPEKASTRTERRVGKRPR